MSRLDDARGRVNTAVHTTFWGLLACTTSCSAPKAAEPLDHAHALEALARRGDVAATAGTLDRLGLRHSSLPLPEPADCTDPQSGGFWLVRALAWSPEIRASAHVARAAIGELDGAGSPLPIGVGVTAEEIGGDSSGVSASVVFDVLGLIGVGPSRADRRRLDAAAALTLAELEVAVWQSWLAVEAARVRFVAASARERRAGELAEQARDDLVRTTILLERGWLGEAPAATARAAVASTERMHSIASETVTNARATLLHLAGVPEGDAAIDALSRESSAGLDPVFTRVGNFNADLLETHPELCALRLQFALREAEVRSVAASAWPSLGLGPHLAYEDNLAIGAVLRLDIPFPSSWRGRLNSAIARRDTVVDAYEDDLHSLLVREESALNRLIAIEARRGRVLQEVVAGSRQGWEGARSSFRVGRIGVIEWVEALSRRRDTVAADIDDAELFALATVDLAAARGPAGVQVPWSQAQVVDTHSLGEQQ